MENRGQKHHRERLGEAIREEIATILEGELGDPRIGLVTVTEILMAPDGKSVHAVVAVAGDEDEAVETMEGLMAARGFIRREVGNRLGLRQPPELHFQLDHSEQYRTRVEELLKRVKKKSRGAGREE